MGRSDQKQRIEHVECVTEDQNMESSTVLAKYTEITLVYNFFRVFQTWPLCVALTILETTL